MKYAVIYYVADAENTNQFNSIHCYEFITKERAEAFITKAVEKNKKDYKHWLDSNGIEHSEEVTAVAEEENKVRIRYDVKTLREEDHCFNTRYEILELR